MRKDKARARVASAVILCEVTCQEMRKDAQQQNPRAEVFTNAMLMRFFRCKRCLTSFRYIGRMLMGFNAELWRSGTNISLRGIQRGAGGACGRTHYCWCRLEIGFRFECLHASVHE